MGGIEPTRNANAKPLDAGRAQPLHQSLHLDVERLIAIQIEAAFVSRHEGEARNMAFEANVALRLLELEPYSPEFATGGKSERRRIIERARSQPLQPQSLDIDVRNAHLRRNWEAVGFGKQAAELIDAGLAVPGEV